VEPRDFRDRRGREKRLPGELMYLGAPFAPCVRHDDRNVVAGDVVAKYPFERSERFPVIQPNCGPQRLFAFELRRWEAQLGPRARIKLGPRARISAGCCLRWQELPRFSADAESSRHWA